MQLSTKRLSKATIVGRWKLTQFIGEGGQGEVWQVRPTGTKHSPPRALKACFSSEPRDRARFEQEVELLRRCASQHVLPLIDASLDWQPHVDELPAFAYYVAERFDGNLTTRQKSLGSIADRLQLFRQACDSVAFLHELDTPVLHRDIKPDNFLIGGEPRRIVIADFGIAHPEGSLGVTDIHEVVGSRFFRAPEVASGGKASALSDVYSLGRLLEWLLTGETSEDFGIRPVVRGGPISDEACDILERILHKATASRPSDRYARVRELQEAIPNLWLAPKSLPAKSTESPSSDPSEFVEQALQYARAQDRISWRTLENQVRRLYQPELIAWRTNWDRRTIHNEGDVLERIDDLLIRTRLRLLLPLAGVFSEVPGMVDQRRTVEDLPHVGGWNFGGLTINIGAPRGLLYLFHYLHGALCLELHRRDLAIALALSSVRDDNQGKPHPLWKLRDLTCWPALFGGNSKIAWNYLRALPEKLSVLERFFGTRRDFEIGLASYSMLLSLIELAVDAKRVISEGHQNLDLDVAPVFLLFSRDVREIATSRTFGNRESVEEVAGALRADPADMRRLWPVWRESILRHRVRGDPDRWYDEIVLGDLA